MKNIPKLSNELKDKIWLGINEGIEKKEKKGFLSLIIYRPAYLFSSLAMVVVLSFFIFRSSTVEQAHTKEELSELYAYIAYEEPDFGTSIEEFLF